MNKTYLRGDIYYANLEPVVGSEQGGCRPVLIVQNNTGNRRSPTVIIAPITSKSGIKATQPTHYYVKAGNGLAFPSIILTEQLRTIDKSRLQNYIGRLDKYHIKGINHAMAISIGLIEPFPSKLTMCLCSTCADNFYGTGSFILHRTNTENIHNELCVYCNTRQGSEYEIGRKK